MNIENEIEQHLEFVIDEHFHDMRIDQALAKLHPEISRTRWANLLLDGIVLRNFEPCTKLKTKVKSGDIISATLPIAAPLTLQPENIPLEVLFEDAHIIVINKPAGLVVHPAPGNWSGTLVNALLHHCGASLSGIGGIKRPGIVHRLDKDTSGIMVVAKSDKAHENLSSQFAAHGRDGKLKREYIAFTIGIPKNQHGTVNLPIGRDPHNRLRMAINGSGAREAITHWELIEHFGNYGAKIRCALETGRTHQIRVHMANAGLPIIGDPVYGGALRTKLNTWGEPAKTAAAHFPRQALHAAVLGFEHPITKEDMFFERDVPEDMRVLENDLSS